MASSAGTTPAPTPVNRNSPHKARAMSEAEAEPAPGNKSLPDALLVCAPACIYWVQNNLRYVAAGCIDASTYFVTFQSKTIWAVFLSMAVFGRYITVTKWVGILTLLGGVAQTKFGTVAVPIPKEHDAVVQQGKRLLLRLLGSEIEDTAPENNVNAVGVPEVAEAIEAEGAFTATKCYARTWFVEQTGHPVDERTVGFVVVLVAAFLSALGGVAAEKVLKNKSTTIWVRNIQMSFASLCLAVLPQLLKKISGGDINFLHDFTFFTFFTVLYNAVGGLLVA